MQLTAIFHVQYSIVNNTTTTNNNNIVVRRSAVDSEALAEQVTQTTELRLDSIPNNQQTVWKVEAQMRPGNTAGTAPVWAHHPLQNDPTT